MTIGIVFYGLVEGCIHGASMARHGAVARVLGVLSRLASTDVGLLLPFFFHPLAEYREAHCPRDAMSADPPKIG